MPKTFSDNEHIEQAAEAGRKVEMRRPARAQMSLVAELRLRGKLQNPA